LVAPGDPEEGVPPRHPRGSTEGQAGPVPAPVGVAGGAAAEAGGEASPDGAGVRQSGGRGAPGRLDVKADTRPPRHPRPLPVPRGTICLARTRDTNYDECLDPGLMVRVRQFAQRMSTRWGESYSEWEAIVELLREGLRRNGYRLPGDIDDDEATCL
jgi:hypothetical protein